MTKVATGVSAHLELLERARDAGAQLVLAHHGLFWDFLPRALTEQMAARLRVALEAELSVAGYHLPLDAHPEIGNNALLCAGLGFEPDARAVRRGARPRDRRRSAAAPSRSPAAELFAAVAELLGREPLVFDAGPGRGALDRDRLGRRRLAARRGGRAAASTRSLTGEPAEHAMADAREGGVHFIAAGHYATETLGIRRLGELVAERFEVEHEFIDVPNPV